MIEFRWKVEQWEEYPLDARFPIKKQSDPVLQFRVVNLSAVANENATTDWVDVPTKYVKVNQ